jgi:hypothetical protein
MTNHKSWTERVALALVATAALAAAGCDFTVTNPGPVADANLDSLGTFAARRALVTGARRQLSLILGAVPSDGYGVAYWSAAAAFEINPAGSTGSWGIPPALQAGDLRADDSPWSGAQQARWIAEDAIRRFKARAVPEDSLYATLELWAGYSNRLLGENFCDAVIDGGPKEPITTFFIRADSSFTEALRIATALPAGTTAQQNTRTALMRAAYAGRASVRADLATWTNNNATTWANAVADAGQVTLNTFAWQMPYYASDVNQSNSVYWSIGNNPYRAHTEWATYYEDYYRTTRDARVAWDTSALRGDAAVQRFSAYPNVVNSRVPFYPEAKYKSQAAAINLSTGWETRLIEAEYALAVNNDAATAVAKMNLRRTALGLPALTVSTVAQAWTDLKRERMMELWLEARRLGDLRRWDASGAPGQALDGVWVTGESSPRETMTSPVARALCWPISTGEMQTNPNLR